MKKNVELPEVKPVTIKPLLGMKPGQWLLVCYLICFLMIFFALGVLPGIINGYKRVTFKNEKGPVAAVYVDNNYRGGTPFTTNISSGKHHVEYRLGDAVLDEFDVKIGHPIFLTLFIPRNVEIKRSAQINEAGYAALTDNFFRDVAAYSAVLTYDSVYQYPPVFENYAKSIKDYNYKENVFLYAVQFITSRQMLEDAKKAFELLGISYDFTDIETAVANKTFRTQSLPIYGTIVGTSLLDAGKFSVTGFNYTTFNLASVPVNETMYAFFVEENPFWAESNKEELIAEGLVDENYLKGITLSTERPVYRPIRNISFYAAKAFCKWMSETTGKNVHLPSEIEWTAAASSADPTFTKTMTALSSKSGPSGMFGGVWEFTSTYYVPNASFIDSDIQTYISTNGYDCEPIVKGGCYTSDVSSISAYTIGLVSPFLCSDYYGFRIAWE